MKLQVESLRQLQVAVNRIFKTNVNIILAFFFTLIKPIWLPKPYFLIIEISSFDNNKTYIGVTKISNWKKLKEIVFKCRITKLYVFYDIQINEFQIHLFNWQS